MKPSVLAARAVAAEFAYRVFMPLLVVVALISLILIALMVVLIILSEWWLLLAVPVFILILLVALVMGLAGIVIYAVSPRPTKVQKKQVASFVDKLQRVSEVTHTPKFVLLFRAIKDIATPTKNGYIGTIVSDTASLHGEYKRLLAVFSDRT